MLDYNAIIDIQNSLSFFVFLHLYDQLFVLYVKISIIYILHLPMISILKINILLYNKYGPE